MPYINQNFRTKLNSLQNLRFELAKLETDRMGALNYIITELIQDELFPLQYRKINDLIGMLECCKLELYRRVAHYEDKKIKENGDVYRVSES